VTASFVEDVAGGCRLRIVVVPRASRTEVVGVHGDALKIRIAAPPVDGAANEELIAFVARWLEVGRSLVSVTTGQSSRRKTLQIQGIAADSVLERLGGER
jgi:uncharacterized protein (TIGR00251 family)